MNRHEKAGCICLLLAVLLLAWPQMVWAEAEENLLQEQLDMLPTEEIYALMEQLDLEMDQYMGGHSLQDFWQGFLQGDIVLDLDSLLKGGLRIFRQEVACNVSIVGKVIFLVILAAVLGRLSESLASDGVGKMAHLVVMFVILLLVVNSVRSVAALAGDTVERLVDFMQLLLPVQFILMAALGNGAAMAALQPAMVVGINLMANLFRYVLLPLIYFEMLLCMANSLSDQFKVEKLAGLFRTVVLAVMGVCSTMFLGLIGLQGFGGAVVDGLSVRTVKYAASTFVPVVGGMLSDAYETILGGSLLIKNAFGLVGMLVIVLILLVPAVKIFVIYLMYKFTAAIIEPIGEKQATEMVSQMANSFLLVFATVVFVALTFFFSIVILTVTANATVMLR